MCPIANIKPFVQEVNYPWTYVSLFGATSLACLLPTKAPGVFALSYKSALLYWQYQLALFGAAHQRCAASPCNSFQL
jgi:hypothetical protein